MPVGLSSLTSDSEEEDEYESKMDADDYSAMTVGELDDRTLDELIEELSDAGYDIEVYVNHDKKEVILDDRDRGPLGRTTGKVIEYASNVKGRIEEYTQSGEEEETEIGDDYSIVIESDKIKKQENSGSSNNVAQV